MKYVEKKSKSTPLPCLPTDCICTVQRSMKDEQLAGRARWIHIVRLLYCFERLCFLESLYTSHILPVPHRTSLSLLRGHAHRRTFRWVRAISPSRGICGYNGENRNGLLCREASLLLGLDRGVGEFSWAVKILLACPANTRAIMRIVTLLAGFHLRLLVGTFGVELYREENKM